MRFFISTAAVIALIPMVLGQGPKINTLTSPTQCEPVQFTWQGGVPPYYLSLVPGGQPQAQALRQFPAQNGDSMTWTVDLPAGTSFTSSLRDSTGAQAFSDIQTVQSGPDNSCLSNSVSETASMTMSATSMSSTGTSAASTNAATTTSAPDVAQKAVSTTMPASSTISASGTGVHAVTSGASSTSAMPTSSNAASLHTSAGAIGVAGLLGLVGAALLG
ncbi:hypothetical protein BD414DRAFT_472131 [Trametes punicea]|nr:hypothetical protein BD414DRAFT_472131 [Trametes punicea]